MPAQNLMPVYYSYNSAVFQSSSSFDYTVAVVKDSFFNDATWSVSAAEERARGDWSFVDDWRINPPNNYTDVITNMREDVNDAKPPYMWLNVSACFDYYSRYFTPQGNGFIFVKNQWVQDPPTDSLLLYVSVIPRNDDWAKNLWALTNGTFPIPALIRTSPPSQIEKWFVGKPRYEVDHCLVQQPPWSEERCQLEYSPWILWTCCASNLVKVVVMISIWAAARTAAANNSNRLSDCQREQPLCTLGDSIASFMTEPDQTTIGMSTATMHDFRVPLFTWHFERPKNLSPDLRGPRPWCPGNTQWRHAVSIERWAWFFLG